MVRHRERDLLSCAGPAIASVAGSAGAAAFGFAASPPSVVVVAAACAVAAAALAAFAVAHDFFSTAAETLQA
jgi:hypothetical protein